MAVCARHQITLRKRDPSIAELNDALKTASVADVAQWRFVQHLGDLRNKCDHQKVVDPSKEDRWHPQNHALLTPLAFRAADKFFKFVSWAVGVTVIRLAQRTTGSTELHYLELVATAALVVPLLIRSIYLASRSPSTLNIPEHYHTVSRILQVLASGVILIIISSPYLIMDGILDGLLNARLK
ncbi:hypothetical protein HFO39_33050 [Rhizobium leguminosarum]|uniref:hypothetical protein n=1 Tax=Rhizobium leguminosarum TaxID=384 RepID=UPI001C9767D2|nr:hypothetical protein [Rhizobium leguminosarum]MBY5639521.1 hypothetical protein [Rhizobium leguminosarum]